MNFPGAAIATMLVALVLAVGTLQPPPDATATLAMPAGGRELPLPTPSEPPAPSGDPSAAPAVPAPKPAPAKPVDCDKVKCIALTFDDGPVAQTAHVLEVLREHDARATFFVLGSMASKRPDLLRRMLAEGSAIGNHSWNHPQFFPMTSAAIHTQIARTSAVIKRATGTAPTMVRPPYGEQNARIRKVIRGEGAAVVLWSIDTQDWKRSNRNSHHIADYVVKHAKRNAIVLMHDIRPTTRGAVGDIVRRLQAKGFVLVTVPELVGHRLKPGRVYSRG